jgi:amino acid permease
MYNKDQETDKPFVEQESEQQLKTIDQENNEFNEFHDETSEKEHIEEMKRPWWKRYFAPIREGSLRGSTLAMASITFGGGCLAFPYAVSQTGPIVAILLFIIVAIANYYTLYILLEDGMRLKTMDYNGLIVKTMGKKMEVFYDINNFILCLGVIINYQYIVYGYVQDLGYEFFGLEKSDINKLYISLVCMVVIQIPMNMMKNISTLQYASIIGTVALVYSIMIIAVEMPFYLGNYLSVQEFPDLFVPLNWNYLDTFSTFMFGFCAHNGIFQVFDELKRPTTRRYKKVLNRSFVIEIILYTTIAFCGFFSTFYATPDIFLKRDDLPGFMPDYFMKVSKITLFICLHCTMAINNNIMRQSTKSMCFSGKDIPFWIDTVIVIVTYIICNTMVYFIDNVSQILGIIGGVCTVVISFVNPLLIHIYSSNLPKTHFKNMLLWIFLVFISIFGIMATAKSIVDLINKKQQ